METTTEIKWVDNVALDDLRDVTDVQYRCHKEFVDAVTSGVRFKEFFIDYDLSSAPMLHKGPCECEDSPEWDGYYSLIWLFEETNKHEWPSTIHVLSTHPIGNRRLREALNCYGYAPEDGKSPYETNTYIRIETGAK